MKSFCSANGQFSTINATSSFVGSGEDVWFAITPRHAYDLFITVYGEGQGGTLQAPLIKIFSDCNSLQSVPGSSNSADNVTTLYIGGLVLGRTYYLNVSGSNTGTFKLCYQNQNAPVKPGQDCSTARVLCSMESVRETNTSGAGDNPDEAVASCLNNPNPDGTHPNTETNSVWYRWTAGNNGSLVFTITPTVTMDDLDWALFDLGTAGNCNNKGTAIRCANGSGIKNDLPRNQGGGCPDEPVYYKTGLDFNAADISEPKGCGEGQDGNVKFIDMQKDHVYALVINSPHKQGNGFTLDFVDQNGKTGTGVFAGPEAVIDFQSNDPCTVNQTYTFNSLSKNYNSLKWNFGEGANISTASTEGPFTISYSTGGIKIVSLEVQTGNGCSVLATRSFSTSITPDVPSITINKPDFCMSDVIKLSTPETPGLTYNWTGPNNFTSDNASPEILITDAAYAGVYTLRVINGDCSSATANITVPPIKAKPEAAFRTSPGYPAKLAAPVSVQFFNDSKGADSYLWDFGDGSTSTEVNPVHIYTSDGSYQVSLAAYQSKVCRSSVIHGTFVIKSGQAFFIPNTFTPNNDGINDEFVVSLTNLSSFTIKIFNRWGAEIFRSQDIFDNWKGLQNNEQLPTGTYFYVIDAKDFNGKTVKTSGYITLLR